MTRQPKTKPLSVRFTPEERAWMVSKAGRLSLGEFIRKRSLDGKVSAHRKHQPAPPESKKMLAQVLALLGQSQLAKSLCTLSEAAQSGTLPVTAETEVLIQKACRDIADIKRLVMRTLGIKED